MALYGPDIAHIIFDIIQLGGFLHVESHEYRPFKGSISLFSAFCPVYTCLVFLRSARTGARLILVGLNFWENLASLMIFSAAISFLPIYV